jgi:hypothetical protein
LRVPSHRAMDRRPVRSASVASRRPWLGCPFEYSGGPTSREDGSNRRLDGQRRGASSTFIPRTEQVDDATMVKAEVPNLSLNDPSLTARADPERRAERRAPRSEGRASSFPDQDDEAGRESTSWEKVGEDSESGAGAGGKSKAKARRRMCVPWELTVAGRESSGSEPVRPPRR